MNTNQQEIYVIRQDIDYKIGVSKSPMDRLKKLQTASPLKLEMVYRGPCRSGDEKRAHSILEEWRGIGEWFLLPDFIIEEIRALPWRDKKISLPRKLSMAKLSGEAVTKPRKKTENPRCKLKKNPVKGCPLCGLKLKARLIDSMWEMFCGCGWKPPKDA